MKKENFEEKIAQAANWLSDKTKEVYDKSGFNKLQITLPRVFEIILKIIIVLIALAIIKLPFAIITSLSKLTLTSSFVPLNFWHVGFALVLDILYLIVSVIVIFYVFRAEIFNQKSTVKKTTKNKTKKEPLITTNGEDGWLAIVLLIIKVFVIITVIIPLVFSYVSLIMATAVIIYLIFKGVAVYGLLALMIGLMMLISFIIKVIFKVMRNEKVGFSSLVIALILILAGGIATFDWALNLEVKSGKSGVLTTTTTSINVSEYDELPVYGERIYTVNEKIEDNILIAKNTFNKEYQNIASVNDRGDLVIHGKGWENGVEFANEIIQNLKRDIIYIPYFKTELIGNSKTLNLVNTSKSYTIVDETNICAEAMQEFYQDDTYRYYFNCIKDETTFVIVNGKKIKVSEALKKKLVTIEDLDRSGLEFYKENKNLITN